MHKLVWLCNIIMIQWMWHKLIDVTVFLSLLTNGVPTMGVYLHVYCALEVGKTNTP